MNKSNQKPIPLTPQDTTHTLAIKCYEEQCINGIEGTLRAVREIDDNCYECYAIVHDKSGKKHLHICIRLIRGKSAKVSKILKSLGIHFREEDEQLMINHGLETVGKFTGYLIYLTHKDAASVKACKDPYEISDFVTNMDRAKFSDMMQKKLPKRKLSATERSRQNCIDSKQAGYDLWNYNSWKKTKELEFVGYSEKKLYDIHEFFKKGQYERITEEGYIPQIVICINIPIGSELDDDDLQIISSKALEDMNIPINGYSDKASVDSATLIKLPRRKYITRKGSFSDTKDDQTLEKLDPGKFSYNNELRFDEFGNIEAWTYKIIITMDSDEDGAFSRDPDKSYYYCTLSDDDKELLCKDVCKRGTEQEQTDRKQLYISFRDAFNLRLKDYKRPSKETAPPPKIIDYSDILS